MSVDGVIALVTVAPVSCFVLSALLLASKRPDGSWRRPLVAAGAVAAVGAASFFTGCTVMQHMG